MIRYALFAVAILLAGIVVGLIIGKLTQSPSKRAPVQARVLAPQPWWPGIVAAILFVAAAVLATVVWIAQS